MIETIYHPTRKSAREAGAVVYLTDKPCPHGHHTPRYTSNGACTGCLGIRTAAGMRGALPPRTCRRCGEIVTTKACHACRKPVAAAWRSKNRQKLSEGHRCKVDVCRAFVRQFKTDNPCTDCSHKHPWYVMEFDHLHGRAAVGDITIARVVSTGSVSRVKREMAKCELVCANCHKARTHRRAVDAGTVRL